MAEWETEEAGTTPGEDEETPFPADDGDWEGEGHCEELRLPPWPICSPDAEDLPPPFFPPSRESSPPSLSPDACYLPQPRFDQHPLASVVNSQPSMPGADPQPSLWYGPLPPIMFPDPEDVPSPAFDILGVEAYDHLGPDDNHQDGVDWSEQHQTTGRLGRSFWEVVMDGGKGPEPHHHQGWLGESWGNDKFLVSGFT